MSIIASRLEALQNEVAKKVLGLTPAEAIASKVCIKCKSSINPTSFYSEAGVKEYKISGLCEPCFDGLAQQLKGIG